MSRALNALTVLAVGAAGLGLAQPAAAAGETYVWVATGAGDFDEPANWERQSDGEPGLPGAEDTALIIDPPGMVMIDSDVVVGTLSVDAPSGGELDLALSGFVGGSLEASTVVLAGDISLRGPLTVEHLTLSGEFDLSTDAITLGSAEPEGRGQLVLDGASIPAVVGIDEPVDVAVVGTELSDIDGLVLGEAAGVELESDEGATLSGTIFAAGDLVLAGDVPPDARVYIGSDGPLNGGTLLWDEPDAVMAGLLWIAEASSAALPDDLSVQGILDVVGSASGGSLDIGSAGALRFTDAGDGSDRQPSLVLGGSFSSEPGGAVWVEPSDGTCIGDEDVLVRAAGGVTFPPGEMHLDAAPTWFDLEGVALGTSLVSVVRRVDGLAEESCTAGRWDRVARSMYRDLIGRLGEASGVAFWATRMAAGASPVDVAAALLGSAAARGHLVRQTWADYGCGGDPPSELAVAMGAEHLRAGGSLAVLRASVLNAAVPPGGDPVDCLYQAVLGRAPDPGGRAYVEGRLDDGESLGRISRKVMTTSEGRRVQFSRLNRRLLGRAATPDEVTGWTAQIVQGHSEIWVTARVAGSPEYATRASV